MAAIGIVGGVGPEAGLGLAHKVFANTEAKKDQQHIDLYLTSIPAHIPDRTEFLLNGGENPAPGLQKSLDKLISCGATALAIACNTAHSPKIISQLNFPQNVRFVNMIETTTNFLAKKFSGKKVGIIATLGTLKTGVYADYAEKCGAFSLILPNEENCNGVQDAIYNTQYGIKALNGPSEQNFSRVSRAVDDLIEQGAAAIILGCTELPLVFKDTNTYKGAVLVDPCDLVAMELIKTVDETKLKSF